MTTLEDLQAELSMLKAAEAALLAKINARKAETLVRCGPNNHGTGCGQGFAVRELEYVQTHRYVPPRGCTDGDYWDKGEGQWVCPKCKHLNRLYDKPDVVALKSLFKAIKDIYER